MTEPFDAVQFNQELEAYARSLDVDLYGVASAQAYMEQFPDKPAPTRFVADAQSVIVMGIQFEPSTVATVLHPDLANMRHYTPEQIANPRSIEQPTNARRHFLFDEREMLENELTYIGWKMARYIRKAGWRSFHVPVIKHEVRTRPPFQHMPAIYLAGLGTLGLNCCIINPVVGPRGYYTTLITNCPLPHGEPMQESLCTGCNTCVVACPKGCIDGHGWKDPGPCDCCRLCIAVCPVGADAKEVRSYPG